MLEYLFWGRSSLAPGALVFASLVTGDAYALDRFKVSDVACEMFWYSKHTPVVSYDIVDDRQVDYEKTPGPDYFRQAAQRTKEFCERTSKPPRSLFGAPREIRGIWFQSNDHRFKALFSFDADALDEGATVTNRIGDEYAARQRAIGQKADAERRQTAQLEEIRTRDARARQLRDAQEKAAREKVAADNARGEAFMARKDLQVSRLGAEVTPANFTTVENVRTNPFHFKKLGLAVVRTTFDKMVSARVAMFGNVLAPIFVHIDDVDRFTRSGETVMLAFRVTERGEVERSYGSLPEIVMSALRAEPIFGEYVGAFTCPGNDCERLVDVSSPG